MSAPRVHGFDELVYWQNGTSVAVLWHLRASDVLSEGSRGSAHCSGDCVRRDGISAAEAVFGGTVYLQASAVLSGTVYLAPLSPYLR